MRSRLFMVVLSLVIIVIICNLSMLAYLINFHVNNNPEWLKVVLGVAAGVSWEVLIFKILPLDTLWKM